MIRLDVLEARLDIHGTADGETYSSFAENAEDWILRDGDLDLRDLTEEFSQIVLALQRFRFVGGVDENLPEFVFAALLNVVVDCKLSRNLHVHLINPFSGGHRCSGAIDQKIPVELRLVWIGEERRILFGKYLHLQRISPAEGELPEPAGGIETDHPRGIGDYPTHSLSNRVAPEGILSGHLAQGINNGPAACRGIPRVPPW